MAKRGKRLVYVILVLPESVSEGLALELARRQRLRLELSYLCSSLLIQCCASQQMLSSYLIDIDLSVAVQQISGLKGQLARNLQY